MKKYILIALILLVGGALLIVPLLNSDDPDNPGNGGERVEELPASFKFVGNPGTFFGKEETMEITINAKNIASMEVLLDGKSLQIWNAPKSNQKLTFVGDKVGTYSFDLLIKTTDGKDFIDSRSIRILSDIEPRLMQANIVKTYPHNTESYTQGLEFDGNELYESTGLNGKSRIQQVELETGKMLRKLQLDGTYFGEGLTIVNDKIYQLTWQSGRCFTYNFSGNFELTGDMSYVGEGWGLCHDDKNIIMSNGTEFIVFRNPSNFVEVRRIQVYNDRGAITQLNELEYIDGKIYANVYQTNIVVVIDPETGRVVEQISCDKLYVEGRGMGDVLNGIARHPSGKVYMTGKNWPKLFEVNFTEVLP